MVHKNRKITRMLSAILAAVIILTSGGFEVLAENTGERTEWESASEDKEATVMSKEASDEESDSPRGTGETPEADSDSTPGTEETSDEESENTPETDQNPEKDSESIPGTAKTPEEDSDNIPESGEALEETPEGSVDAGDAESAGRDADNSNEQLTKSVNIADGSYGNITWSIDGDGQLTVTGTGDFSAGTDITRAPWYNDRETIKSAVVNVTDMTDASYMFYDCYNLGTLDVTGFDTSNVENMSYMFFGCANLEDPDLSKFNTSNVRNMSYMFQGCSSLRSLSLINFNTGEVTNMRSMFSSCSSLTYLDISGFDTRKVTNMQTMFSGCSSLASLNLSSFDAANAANMADMLNVCYSLGSIYTPYNVTQSVSLPDFLGDVWYAPDGTQITELPQNLNYSVLITKNKVPAPLEPEQKILLYAPYNQSQEGQTLNISERFADYSGITGYEIISYTEDEEIDGNVLSSDPTINNGVLYYSTNAGIIGDFATIIIELTCIDQDNVTLIITICLKDMESDIASGSYKNITWTIDTAGKLTVMGRGEFSAAIDFERAPWYEYRDSILSAEVNVTDIINISYMFSGCTNLSSVDLSSLDTSDATNMRSMFYECHSLRSLDLSDFDTSNVTDMANMFSRCYHLESLNISSFNTAKVIDMNSMFHDCNNLSDLKIDGFDTAKVADMGSMFSQCSSLKSLDVTGFNTAEVTDMGNMFANCYGLENLDVSGFKTANVTNMNGMFSECGGLKSLDVSGFDTSNVTGMRGMFAYCIGLSSLDISNFDTSKVTDMGWYIFPGMFEGCSGLTSLDLSNFDTSSVIYMSRLFENCTGLESLDLSSFDTSHVEDMSYMFANCVGLSSLDLSSFDTSHVEDMRCMFVSCTGLTSLDVSSFDVSSVVDMSSMFYECRTLRSLDLNSFYPVNVTDMSNMFDGCNALSSLNISNFNAANATDMDFMFNGCTSLTSLDSSGFRTPKVTNMDAMFYECSALRSLDLSSFDTSNVKSMLYMFGGCGSLTDLNVSSFDTANVEDMGSMFSGCSSLTSLDVSSFDTASVTNMASMFAYCRGLTSLDVSGFDTANVTNMSGMFASCDGLKNLVLSQFNTSNVTSMARMFANCTGLISVDVSSFNTSKVTAMNSMFASCYGLARLDLSSFDLSSVTFASSLIPDCENFTLIYTPRNLTLTIELPDYGTWYKADGTKVTKLPTNLNYSIALQRDKAPTSSSTLTVRKKKTVYICGEELIIDDITVSFCDSDGIVKTVTDFTTNADEIDMSVPGRKILKVTYNGITAEVELRVICSLEESRVTVTLPYETFVYSRQPITPEPKVTVTINGTQITLSEGRDYRVSYHNNINAGDTAQIIITGQGDYSGTVTETFTIDKAPLTITASDITLVAGDAMPDASVFEYQVQGICRGDKLIKSPLFTCNVTDMTQTGTYSIIPYGADAGTNYEISYYDGTLTVVEEGVYHTVHFDLLGHGDNMIRRGIKTGTLLKEPPEPQDPGTSGYFFAGWYKDKSFTTKQKWNFATDTVQEDITLYACWLNMAADNGKGADLCIQDILPQAYTGSAIKPTVLVYDSDGTNLLKAGKDYTISYYNNTESDARKFEDSQIPDGGVGTLLADGSIDKSAGFHESLAYVVIKGKGNYTGTVYKNFHIDRASVSDGDGTASGITLKYTESLVYNDKKDQSPFTSIKYKKAMTAGQDYTITLSAEPGEAYSAKAVDGAGVPLEEKWQQANDGKTLPKIPKGYYGTFKITVEGIGNYSGVVEKTVFVSADKNHLMKNANVTLGKNQKKRTNATKEELEEGITLTPAYYDVSDKKYYLPDENGELTGEAIDKIDDLFIVKSGSTYLMPGKDYTVSYTNNHAIGTATMIIQGIGEYTGTKNISFKITGTPFKNIIVEGLTDMPFTGKAVIQSDITLTNGSDKTDAEYKEFEYGSDYIFTYKNNLKKGTATITFTAKPESGYSGSFKKTFKITAADLDQTVTASAAEVGDSLSYGQGVYTFSGTVYYTKSGAVLSDRIHLTSKEYADIILKEGTDYKVSYADNKVVTTGADAVMTITGKGNYQGILTVKFPITVAPMSAANKNLTITASAAYYDGKKAKYEPKIKVTDGKKTLSAGDNKDYVVAEYRNTEKAAIEEYLRLMRAGTNVPDDKKPQAIISGRGNYDGNFTQYFDVYDTKISSNNLYIVVSNDYSQITYTGKQLRPEIAVYYGEDAQKVKAARLAGERNERILTDTGYGLIRLANLTDYTLIWGSNVTAGKNKGSVTVVGTGLYGGRVAGRFTILGKDIYT